MAAVQRQPFGELGASRLQGLISQKNCQNAISDMLGTPHKLSSKPQPLSSHKKRPLTPVEDDSDVDTENQYPSLHLSKGSKVTEETPSKRLKLTVVATSLSIPEVNASNTPTSPLFGKASSTPNEFTFNATSGARSAPAGRSPKHKRVGLLGKKRSSMSPFKRVNPPVFGSSTAAGLPFSIDAALNGTLSRSRAPAPSPPSVSAPVNTLTPIDHPVPAAKVATIEESMPSGWFFNIHEDTLEEEAANLMEHSTGILDISSDDEASPRQKDDRGKENIPPIDHVDDNVNAVDDPNAKGKKRNLRIDPDAMKDVGDDRTPLENLNAEDFYGRGLDKSSVEIVKEAGQPDEQSRVEVSNTARQPSVAEVVDAESHSHNTNITASVSATTNASDPSATCPADQLHESASNFEIAIDEDCAGTSR